VKEMAMGRLVLGFLMMLLVFSGVATAKTLVAGTVYASSPDAPLSGVQVNVQCGSTSSSTTSLSDGAYALFFEENCNSVNITTDPVAEFTKILLNFPDDSASESIQQAINEYSYGGYKVCGNGKCESWETSEKCPEDCLIQEPEEEIENEVEEEELPVPEDQNAFQRITGAVTGTIGTTGGIVILAIIVFLATFFSVRSIRKALKKKRR
jgi:hypothetical protein